FLIRDVLRTAAKVISFFDPPNFARNSPCRQVVPEGGRVLNVSITRFWNGFWQLKDIYRSKSTLKLHDMKTVTKWLAAVSGAAAILLFFACNKSNSSNSNPNIPKGQSQVSLYMMDGPMAFTKVLIDIRQVTVEIDTASKQNDADEDDEWDNNFCGRHRTQANSSIIWDTLDIKPGVYN